MKLLIIGGCGYIGSALYTRFHKKYEVDTVDLEYFGNFVNPNNIKLGFDELKKEYLDRFDAIIFLAGNSSVKLCSDPFDTFDNNVGKFINLVKKLNKQKFIYASSSCVYVESGNSAKVETDLCSPIDGLTFSKTTIDNFMPLTNVEYYALRFGSVNGWSPNMRLDLMINSMTLSAQKNGILNVFNGECYRPILGINDLVSGIEKIIESKHDHRGVYNMKSFNNTISNIGHEVAKVTNSTLIDKGKDFTYNFSILTDKFSNTYNFQFTDTVQSIVTDIIARPYNDKWSKREKYELQTQQ